MFENFTQIKSLEEIKEIFLIEDEKDLFTEKELESVDKKNKLKSLGARYLIKKSIFESLKIENKYKDVEILNEENGKPFINFSGRVNDKMNEIGIVNVQVSISHSRNFVSSMVILEKNV